MVLIALLMIVPPAVVLPILLTTGKDLNIVALFATIGGCMAGSVLIALMGNGLISPLVREYTLDQFNQAIKRYSDEVSAQALPIYWKLTCDVVDVRRGGGRNASYINVYQYVISVHFAMPVQVIHPQGYPIFPPPVYVSADNMATRPGVGAPASPSLQRVEDGSG